MSCKFLAIFHTLFEVFQTDFCDFTEYDVYQRGRAPSFFNLLLSSDKSKSPQVVSGRVVAQKNRFLSWVCFIYAEEAEQNMFRLFCINKQNLTQESKQDTGCNGRADNACDVGAHSVHEQIVALVVFETHFLRYPCRVGHCRYAGVADEGLILLPSLRKRLNSLTKSTPADVAITNESAPRANMPTLFTVRKVVACVGKAPTVRPMSIVTMSMSGPLAVLAKRRVTPLSLSRLPKKSIPKGADRTARGSM